MHNLTVDIYSGILGGEESPKLPYSWVPRDSRRRLAAYTGYSMLYYNCYQLNKTGGKTERIKTEDGTASLIVNTFSDSVLGDRFSIIPSGLIDEQGKPDPKLAAQLGIIELWRGKTLLDSVFHQIELHASMLGDSTLRLRWSSKHERPEIMAIDPGFFFPDFDEDGELRSFSYAWEVKDGSDTRIYKEDYYFNDAGICCCTAGYYKLASTKPSLDDLKLIEYKRNENGEELNNYSLGIDFMPVVYVPNILLPGEDFGISDLAPVVHLLEKLSDIGSDIIKNADLLGGATLIVEGKQPMSKKGDPEVYSIGPGQIFWTGGDKVHVLDTSAMSDAGLKVLDMIEAKIFRNSRVTELAVGKLSGGEIPSGVALQMLQYPFLRTIYLKRLIRADKYSKLMKYVTRFYRLFGASDEYFENEEFECQFGNILPIDRQQLLDELISVVSAGIITTETAIDILHTITGWDIPEDEFTRLQHEKTMRMEM